MMKYLLIIVLLFACACNKDAGILSKTTTNNVISYVVQGTAVRLDGELYYLPKDSFGVALDFAGADTIYASIDTSLIAGFNSQYGEHYPVIASNAFRVNNNGVFHANDSLFVTLWNANVLEDQHVYLVPVRLRSNNNNTILYFKVEVSAGDLTGKMSGAPVQNYIYPSFRSGYLYINYDRVLNSVVPDVFKIGVALNNPFPYHEVTLSVGLISDSIMKVFAKANLSYDPQPFPDGSYRIRKQTVTFPVDSLHAIDSIEIEILDRSKFASLTNYYLGIQVTKDSSVKYSVPAASDSAGAFIRIYTW